MTVLLKLFLSYISVGVINTIIHWVVFSVIHYMLHANQALSNFVAFCVAVSFSFYANAKFTFKAQATTTQYMLYVWFMGALSVATGWFSERCGFAPVVTLISFSAISLVCGFIYSKFIVFRSKKA